MLNDRESPHPVEGLDIPPGIPLNATNHFLPTTNGQQHARVYPMKYARSFVLLIIVQNKAILTWCLPGKIVADPARWSIVMDRMSSYTC